MKDPSDNPAQTPSGPAIAAAIADWGSLLGESRVIVDAPRLAKYASNTIAVTRQVPVALIPAHRDQVPDIVRIAARHQVPLYSISTGNNWGYGSALPVRDGCALLDLSGLTQVIDLDPDLGLVTVEPGVTQRALRDYLDERGLDFLVPVTGAGPDCSLLGNAVERGYGITPYADHFGAVMQIEVVLANGELYRGALAELGGSRVDQAFKWGLGPYLDGLFTQSNLGIVVSMTIALAPKPERVLGFFFGVRRHAELGAAAACVRDALREIGGVGGSINLMNRRRVLSMVEPYPSVPADSDGLIPEAVLDDLAGKNQVMAWTGAGALYGNRRLVAAAKRVIRKALRPTARRLVFFSPETSSRLAWVSRRLPGALGARATRIFGTLDKSLQLLAGTPSEIALPLSYWRSGRQPGEGQAMNPARDGCGLIWYSPLVPLSSQATADYVAMVERVCRKHAIEPLITLTSLSERCWDSTVPLLFDPNIPDQVERAWACFGELLAEGMREGFVPYRTNIASMDKLIRPDTPHWRLVAAIKQVMDPAGILAPGRYSPSPRS